MDADMIVEALKFMVLGMGVVFTFLYIMVLSIKIQAYIVGKYFPDKIPTHTPASVASNTDEKAHVAAVIAAVTEFRKNKS